MLPLYGWAKLFVLKWLSSHSKPSWMLSQMDCQETLNSSGCACVAWSNKLRTTLAPSASVTASGTLRTCRYAVSGGADSAARLVAGDESKRRANEASRNTTPCARTGAQYRAGFADLSSASVAILSQRRGDPTPNACAIRVVVDTEAPG